MSKTNFEFITGLWAPVGLRYHATHHLFMSMPYHHNLSKAQRRLVNGLSDIRFTCKPCATPVGCAAAHLERSISGNTLR